MAKKLSALLLLTVLGWSMANFVLKVHWTHQNGTQVQLTPESFAQLAEEERTKPRMVKRNAIKDWKYLWNMGTVYYDLDARTVDFRLLQILFSAFEFFHKYTCIRWKRRIPGDNVKDYVVFTMPFRGVRLCNSAVGRQTGRQYINLDSECTRSLAKVLHQMTHALGFYHMHTRTDRDKYISVYPERADPSNRKFFDIELSADSMGFPYELKSLMHFDGLKYASGSNPTIVSKIPGLLLGNNRALTVQDVTMINTLYSNCQLSCRFSNGQCEQTCTDIKPGDVICSCLQGYKLNHDKKTCYDVDECSVQNGGCEHTCVRHGVWFRCECNKGFSLDKNGYWCRANNLCKDGILKCDQECNFNTCACKDGYQLNADGHTCDDVNECQVNNGGCKVSCVNTVGSRQCTCRSGQYVSIDGISCTAITCLKPYNVANAVVECNNRDMVAGTVCKYKCGRGFKISGAPQMHCMHTVWSSAAPFCNAVGRCQLDNGRCEQKCWANTWDDVRCSCKAGFALHKNGINCTDIEPPTIVMCPQDIYTNTVPKRSFASVTWDLPIFYDNTKAKIVSGPVMQDKIGGVFDIGAHSVEYVIQDTVGLKAYCAFKIKVNDIEAPDMFRCAPTQTFELGSARRGIDFKDVWTPSFWDNSGNVTVVTDLPKSEQLQPRSQEIHYIATDPSGNSAICTIKINVSTKSADCKNFPYELVGGHMRCDTFAFGTQCEAKCDNGYDLTNDGIAVSYICRDNKWKPDPHKMICRKPVKTPVTSRYMNTLKDNIKKKQSRTFFFMPIEITVKAPETNAEGLKAVPFIDFECEKGDIEDSVQLRCYSGDDK